MPGMKSISLAVVGLLFAVCAFSQGTGSAGAEALVRAMRADVMVLEASKAGIARATGEGHFTAAQFKCFDQLSASVLTADLGKVVSKVLSQDEIAKALEFYASPAGVKYMDMKFMALARNAAASGLTFNGKPAVPDPSMNRDEMQAARAFMESGLGKKLESDKVLLRAPETDILAKRIIGNKLKSCGAKVSPLP